MYSCCRHHHSSPERFSSSQTETLSSLNRSYCCPSSCWKASFYILSLPWGQASQACMWPKQTLDVLGIQGWISAQALFSAPSRACPAGTWSWDVGSWGRTLTSDVSYLPSVLSHWLEGFPTQNPSLGPLLSLFPDFFQQSSLPAAFITPWRERTGTFCMFSLE